MMIVHNHAPVQVAAARCMRKQELGNEDRAANAWWAAKSL